MIDKVNVNKDVDQLKESVSEMSKQMAEMAKEKFAKAKDKTKEFGENLEENAYHYGAIARDVLENSQKSMKQSAQYLEDQAKAHPLLAIGLGFCIGMLLGRMSKD